MSLVDNFFFTVFIYYILLSKVLKDFYQLLRENGNL